jgi:hypothetical protein
MRPSGTPSKELPVIRISAFACAATFAVVGIAFAATPPPSFLVKLDPQHGSKIAGTATIVHGSTEPPVVDVTIVLDAVFIPENQYPAGVYAGTCGKLATAPLYRLNPVVGGRSKTEVQPTMKRPKRKPNWRFSVAVFDTTGAHTISCGTLPTMPNHEH